MVQRSVSAEALYDRLFYQGIRHFLPDCSVEPAGAANNGTQNLETRVIDSSRLEVRWLRSRYVLDNHGIPFTTDQWRMVHSIGAVLSARLDLLLAEGLTLRSFRLFSGSNEDRYVSAFLDPVTYTSARTLAELPDRVGDAVDVLRTTSLTRYEGSRVGSGVLLLGRPREGGQVFERPADAVPYSVALNAVRSFYRLCDGVNTVGIVDDEGLLIDLVDIHEWSKGASKMPLSVPAARTYRSHARATLSGGHVCLVLTPNNDLKVFANGREVLQLRDGRWRLLDMHEKYRVWESAVGDETLARTIFTAALNVAESRCGALFVILDDPASVSQLVASGGLIRERPETPFEDRPSKEHLHYLLRGKRVSELPPAVFESVACIDGAIVLDRDGAILAFGAILLSPPGAEFNDPQEGGRTTAALGASALGRVLKVSEDGPISFFQNQQLVWEL